MSSIIMLLEAEICECVADGVIVYGLMVYSI